MLAREIHDPLVTLALSGVDADRHRVGSLDDSAERVEIRLATQHAAVAEALILRTVVAVHTLRVVERRGLAEARRRRSVGSTVARRRLALAGLGVLQQCQAELP